MRAAVILAAIALVLIVPGTASAQRFTFEQTFDIKGPVTIDVTTIRGKIDVVAGPYDRVVVSGAVTVRVAWDSPQNAIEIAQRLAKAPPISRDASTVRLRPPAEDVERRAVTINYHVRVPVDAEVVSESDSGATSISGVARKVTVRTHSAAITLAKLGGDADVDTGSGAVRIDDVRGALRVTTASSGIVARGIAGAFRVRTQSGQVEATLRGDGDVDVETGSSAIRLRGVNGGLTVTTESGRVDLDGIPARAWTVDTGSGAVEGRLHASSFGLDAMTGSGSVKVSGARVKGTIEPRRVAGDIGSGGPLVRISCRSGSVSLAVGR